MLHTWARNATAIIADISSSATANDRGRTEITTSSSTASSPAASPRAWIFGASLRSMTVDSVLRPASDTRRLFPTLRPVRYNLLEQRTTATKDACETANRRTPTGATDGKER